MLHITVPEKEWFNEETNEFIHSKETSLTLEHSLISLSNWEMQFEKPFLNNEESLTKDELIKYIKCMTVQPKNVDDLVYLSLYTCDDLLNQVSNYINLKMTATWFSEDEWKRSSNPYHKEIVTSEVIYYWMIKFGIPVQFEKWHLNRLMTLIRVFEAKEAKPKKRSKNEIMASRRALNEKRKKMLNTRG